MYKKYMYVMIYLYDVLEVNVNRFNYKRLVLFLKILDFWLRFFLEIRFFYCI